LDFYILTKILIETSFLGASILALHLKADFLKSMTTNTSLEKPIAAAIAKIQSQQFAHKKGAVFAPFFFKFFIRILIDSCFPLASGLRT
jgi:hypothetical protein